MQLSHYNLLGAHSQPSLAAKNALAQTIFKLSLFHNHERGLGMVVTQVISSNA